MSIQYIALSLDPYPGDPPGPATLFPFLRREPGSTTYYRWAVLAPSPALNPLLAHLLGAVGFVFDSVMPAPGDVPSSGTWQFAYLPDGLMQPLQDGDGTHLWDLSHYVTIQWPASSGLVIFPSQLDVLVADLATSLWRGGTVSLKGVEYDATTTSFRFGATDPDPIEAVFASVGRLEPERPHRPPAAENPAREGFEGRSPPFHPAGRHHAGRARLADPAISLYPGFQITLVNADTFQTGATPQTPPPFSLAVAHEGGWSDGALLANGSLVVAGSDGRLDLGSELSLRMYRDEMSTNDQFRIECDLVVALTDVPFGAAGPSRLDLGPDGLRLAFTPGSLRLYFRPDSDRRFVATLRLPLIMAEPPSGGLALPEIVRAVDLTSGMLLPELLHLSLDYAVPGAAPWDDARDYVADLGAGTSDSTFQFGSEFCDHYSLLLQRMDDFDSGLPDFMSNLRALIENSQAEVRFALGSVKNQILPPVPAVNEVLTLTIRVQLQVASAQSGLDRLGVLLAVPLELQNDSGIPRLASNRIYFDLEPYSDSGPQHGWQYLDFESYLLALPARRPGATSQQAPAPNEAAHDGYIDLEQTGFSLDFILDPGDQSLTQSGARIYFPGGASSGNPDPTEFENRFVLRLDQLSPKNWPQLGDDMVFLRVDRTGLTFLATLSQTHVLVDRGDANTLKPLEMQPVALRNGVTSRIVVIENQVREATLLADLPLPGFDDLKAQVEAGLRQEKPQQPPSVFVGIQLEQTDPAPLAKFAIGGLQLAVTEVDLVLTWDRGNRQWSFTATAAGALSIPLGSDGAPALDGFAMPQAIKVRGLDLVTLNTVENEVDLTLDEPPYRFSMLDDRFSVAVGSLGLTWRDRQPLRLTCIDAVLGLKAPEVFGVTIEAGRVDLVFTPGSLRVRVDVPEPLTITLELGAGVMFQGKVGLVHDDALGIRYFMARGQVRIDGFTWVDALVKIGTVRKHGGSVASQIVIYGAMDVDVEIFSGVVAKSLGVGLAVNNRLKAISPRPSAEELLDHIDQLQPDDDRNWTEVIDDGSYVEIVGTAMLAATTGGTDLVQTYVLAVVLSIDTNFDVVAGAKLWLQSSVDFVRQHMNNPVLVGAIAFVPRQRTLTAALRTRPNPAIQTNEQLQKILSNTTFRLAFRMAPGLVDYDLQEISYRDTFLGATMLFAGSYRVAAFRDTVLVKAGLSVTGGYSNDLRCGPGGFAFDGSLVLRGDFGGLISGNGVDMYAAISAGVRFSTSAFLVICWTITVKILRKRYSKSFSKTLRLGARPIDLRVQGAIGVRRDGVLGFAGSVGISVPIFGYRLEIAPALAVNGGVIREVQGRVSAFEQRLDEYIAALTTKSALAQLANRPQRLAASEGTWLLYKTVPGGSSDSCYVLLVPATDGIWLTPGRGDQPPTTPTSPDLPATPPPFHDQVTQVTLLTTSGTTDVPLAILNAPWYTDELTGGRFRDAVQALPLDQRDQLDDLVPLFFESTQSDGAADPGTPWADVTVVYDPRVETTDRRFLRREDRNLPPGVLSFEMDPLDDVALSGIASPGVFEEAVRYEDYARRAARLQRHQDEDLDDVENAQAVRARIVRMMLEDLRRPGGPSQFGVYAKDASSTIPNVLGWIVELPHTVVLQIQKVQVTRVDANGTPTSQVVPVVLGDDEFDQVASPVTALPIRQKFKVTDPQRASDGREEGQVVVKAPIRIASELIQAGLKSLGHFQVFRKVGTTTTWSPLSDEVRPRITLLDDVRREIRVQGTVLGILDPGTFGVQLDEAASEISGAYHNESNTSPRWQVFLGAPEQPDDNNFYTIDNYTVSGEVRTLTVKVDAGQQWPPPGVGRGSLYQIIENVTEQVALVEPYLFSDAFPVVDRAFADPVAPAGARLSVSYLLRVVRYGDTTDPDALDTLSDLGRLFPLGSVSLYVPPVDPFPSDLGAVFAVIDLKTAAGTPQDLPFQIVTTGGDAPGLPQVGDRPLGVDDFELWIEPIVRKQSGFYMGGEYGPPDKPSPDSTKVGLADVDPTPPPEFTRGKFRVQVTAEATSAGTGKFRIAAHPLFVPGFGYKLYLRHQVGTGSADPSDETVTDALVTPLPVFLVPTLPGDGFAPTQLRPVDQVEHIPAADYEDIENRTPQLAPLDAFSVGDRFQESTGDNLLIVTADAVSAVHGGIEVVVHDRDDSSLESRLLCETMEEAVFIHSETQFAETSFWTLPPGLRPSKLEPDPSADVTFLTQETDLITTYYLALDGAEEAILRDLSNSWDALDTALKAWAVNGWRGLLVPAGNWVRALLRFLRSPLNVNDQPTLDDVAEMFLALRALVLGLKRDTNNPASWQTSIDDLNALVASTRVTTTDQVPPGASQDDVAAFRDSDLSRQLAAIALRRTAVADDVLAGLDSNVPFYDLKQARLNFARGLDADPVEILPRDQRWAGIQDDYNTSPASYPLTGKLIAALSSAAPGNDGELGLRDRAKDFLDRVKNNVPADRLEALGQIVPRASGLSRVLDGLPLYGKSDTTLTIDLRPHHGVVPGAGSDGSLIAVTSPFDFLPDAAQLALKNNSPLPMPSRDPDVLADQVVSYLNLHERLGFAVDLQLSNALGEPLDPFDVVGALRAAVRHVPNLLDSPGPGNHDALIVVGLQTGSSLRAKGSTPVGYSFAKLVVVPHELTVLLTDRGLVEFGTSPGPAADNPQTGFLLDPTEKSWQLANASDYIGLTLVITQGAAQGQQRTVLDARSVNGQRELTVDSPWGDQVPDSSSVYSLHDDRPLAGNGSVKWLTLVQQWFHIRRVVFAEETPLSDQLTFWWYVRQSARFVLAAGSTSDPFFDETPSLASPLNRRVPRTAPLIPVLVLEPMATGRRTLAAVGGRCQLNWIVPDDHGHRYRVAVRRVSRYEPIVSWAERLSRPVVVFPDAANGVGDPPAWDVTLPRVLPAGRNPVSDSLPVVWLPHPVDVKFQYQITSEGIRAGLNQISAVRTGYRGCLWQFDYDLIDAGGPGAKTVSLDTLLAAVAQGSACPPDAAANNRFAIDRIPRNGSASDRLLANERQVALTDLPFYYHYRLVVRAAYEARPTTPQAPVKVVPAAVPVVRRPPRDPAGDPSVPAPTALRSPAFLGTWKPMVQAVPSSSLPPDVAADLTFTVFLPRNRDHLSPWELDASPPALTRTLLGAAVADDDLPDFAVAFRILYGLASAPPPSRGGAGAAPRLVYNPFCEVVAPWNPAYQPDSFPATAGVMPDRPYVHISPGNVAFLGTDGNPVVDANGVPIPVISVAVQKCQPAGRLAPAASPYSVNFKVRVFKQAGSFDQTGLYVLQTVRDGFTGRATPFV